MLPAALLSINDGHRTTVLVISISMRKSVTAVLRSTCPACSLKSFSRIFRVKRHTHGWLLKLLAETQFVEARVLLYGGIPGEPACSDAGTCFICDEPMGTGRGRPRYGRHASGRICGQEVPQLSCQQRARRLINPADTCPSW